MQPDIVQKKVVLNNLLVNYYYIKGKTDRTLILLHGWGCDGKIWTPLFPELIANDFTIYSLDLPGFGQSQTPPPTYTVSDYTKIVEEFIKKNKLKDVNLIGHSFGGRISIKIGSTNLEDIKTITLADAAGISHQTASTKTKKKVAAIVKPLFKLSFMQPLRKKLYYAMNAEDYYNNPHVQQILENTVNEDLTSFLPKIAIKTLIIWGKEDENAYTPVEDAYAMHKAIAGSKLAVLSPASHFSFIDQPKEFVKELVDFIDKS